MKLKDLPATRADAIAKIKTIGNPNVARQLKAELLAAATQLNAELESPDCDLNDEQRAKREARIDEMIALAEAGEAQAKAIESDEAAARQRRDRINALGVEGSTGRTTTPNEPGENITGGEPQFMKDKMKGFTSPREFFTMVEQAGRGNVKAAEDPRMKYLTAGTDEQQAGSDPYGGFLVPEAMTAGVDVVGVENDPFAGRTTALPMTAPTVKVNALVDKDHTTSVSGGIVTARRSETAAMSASRQQYEQVKFEANSLYGLAYATEELLRDSPASVAALLNAGFTREFQATHIKELLRGTGVGEPEGVQKSPALVSVAKETNQTADTIVYQNIIKMRARIYGYGGAIWLYNHDALPQLMSLVLPVGTGGVPMWQFSALEDKPDTLLGRPAIACEYMETVGDKFDIMCIVPSAIYEGTYQPLESAESVHVRFLNHERAFKFWLRNDARSLWRSALTPNKGANTLSPFVTLDARA